MHSSASDQNDDDDVLVTMPSIMEVLPPASIPRPSLDWRLFVFTLPLLFFLCFFLTIINDRRKMTTNTGMFSLEAPTKASTAINAVGLATASTTKRVIWGRLLG